MKFIAGPAHPFSDGVTLIVPLIFKPVLFAGAFQPVIFPEPEAERPIAVFEFVQVKLPPAGVLPKAGMLMGCCGQTAILLTALTVGVG